MERTWILVADEARARLFSAARPGGPLAEEGDFVNPSERLPEHELGADEPGRVAGGGGRQHTYGREEGMRAHESQRFAADLAAELRKGRERGQYQRLYLVAAPKFLGTLRKALDEQTASVVVDAINKDIVRKKVEDIRRYLPKRL